MLTAGAWHSPFGGPTRLVSAGDPVGASARLLVLPALFDEGHKLRRLTVNVMRMLADSGIASFMFDPAGLMESAHPLSETSLEDWRGEAEGAAKGLSATHILAIRGGALIARERANLLHYAPLQGESLLRAMLRARIIADKEAGMPSTQEDLLARGRSDGLRLAGYALSPAMVSQLEAATHPKAARTIAQSELGGAALWLRAEASYEVEQARQLARLVAEWAS